MLQVGTLLLICTFFFDIFWVFISPVIFKKSVMIEADLLISALRCVGCAGCAVLCSGKVATGGGTGQSVSGAWGRRV